MFVKQFLNKKKKEKANEATANAFALSLAGIAAYQGYGFLKTQSWAPDWIKRDSHYLSYGPFPSKGRGAYLRSAFHSTLPLGTLCLCVKTVFGP